MIGESYNPGGFITPARAVLPAMAHVGPPVSGFGSPEGIVPSGPGQTYHDFDTDDLYLKQEGNQKWGWRLIGKHCRCGVTPVKPPFFYFSSSGGGPTLDQGFDPVLGPPYTPVDYQLFVSAHYGPPSGDIIPVDGAILNWTLPDLTAFSYNFFVGVTNYDWWTSDSSDPATAVRLTAPKPISGFNFFQGPVNYVWITQRALELPVPVAPSNLGAAVPGGHAFRGKIQRVSNENPGTISFTAWSSQSNAFTGFNLYRKVTPFTTVPGTIEGSPLASPSTSPYTDFTVSNPIFYYRLIGHTTQFSFPYNDVSIIKPYSLTAAQNMSQIALTWDAPAFT